MVDTFTKLEKVMPHHILCLLFLALDLQRLNDALNLVTGLMRDIPVEAEFLAHFFDHPLNSVLVEIKGEINTFLQVI